MATTALLAPQTESIDLTVAAREILNRRPAVGLAIAIVRDGRADFHCEGLADIASATPITEDTVFRIASLTKTFTAIAVMQLWERGLIDLDAPANEYLRAFKLVPAKPGFRPATIRHLLTHTAGVREALHVTDAFRLRDMGDTVKLGSRVPSPAQRYRGALRIDAEPGTRFMYTNHGFMALGQIVEDVSGEPLHRYFRAHIFDPLGMHDTSLVRAELEASRFATAYELRSSGPRPTDYEVLTPAAGGASSTLRDMAVYVAALLRNDGSLVRPATLDAMFEPHYQPDPRIPGMGLAFFRSELGGHHAVDHGGVLPGFDSAMVLAPHDDVGVLAFANGARRGMLWLAPEVAAIARRLIGVPEDVVRTDVPHRPDVWPELCGWYHFPASWTDPGKLALGPGVEVIVRDGRLVIRALSPIPPLYRGFVLHPDDPSDPYVFRISVPYLGIGSCRVIFSGKPGTTPQKVHLEAGSLSFQRRPDATNPRRMATGAIVGVLGLAAAVKTLRR